MARNSERIEMRWSKDDKRALEELAEHVSRSQSDTLRQLVRGAVAVIRAEQDPPQMPRQPAEARP